MVEDLTPYLAATRYIDADHPAIGAVVESLVEGDPPRIQTAARLFRFARDTIRYDPFAPLLAEADYVASTILARGHGFCIQKAVLLAALSRRAHVPCRLGFADVRSHLVPGNLVERMGTDVFIYHGYVEFFLNGSWRKATPAFDRMTCEKHGFRLVEFDGTADALLPSTDLAGRPHFEYLREIGSFADVPFADILRAFRETYGEAAPEHSGKKESEPGGAADR